MGPPHEAGNLTHEPTNGAGCCSSLQAIQTDTCGQWRVATVAQAAPNRVGIEIPVTTSIDRMNLGKMPANLIDQDDPSRSVKAERSRSYTDRS